MRDEPMPPTLPDRFDAIEATLEKVVERLETLASEQQATNKKLEEVVKRRDERFYQANGVHGWLWHTIVITTGVVALLSPVLQAIAPAIEKIVSGALGQP
jgi:hypothetical protein